MKKAPQKRVTKPFGQYVTREEFNKLEKRVITLEKFVFGEQGKKKAEKGSK